jgi:acyl-CoA synthetase (AMP-forming)/AMP-acid ligase II
VTRERVTNAMFIPTMLARIVEHLDDATAAVPMLRTIAHSGARLPLPTLRRAVLAFPGVGSTNAYGLTETSSTIAVLDPADHRAAVESTDPAVRARLGSAGRLVPGIEGQIRNGDGMPLAPGQPRGLWVRGPRSQVSTPDPARSRPGRLVPHPRPHHT